ncbi:MAG: hypothetical protein WEC39_02295 [Patescibacteria group bacterium]
MDPHLAEVLAKDQLGSLLRNRSSINRSELLHLEEAILLVSPVINLKNSLPGKDQMPYLVFWSADWCYWCPVFAPTFLTLAKFFDRAPIYFCEQDDLRRQARVSFVPQISAYFPGGVVARSQCGSTATEFWNKMNLLLTLGTLQSTGDFTLISVEGEDRLIKQG